MIESRAEISPIVTTEARPAKAWKSVILHALVAVFLFLSGGFVVTAPLALFVPVTFMSVGLRLGSRAALTSSAIFLGMFAALTFLLSADGSTSLELSVLFSILLAIVIPSLVATALVRRETPAGKVLVLGLASSVVSFAVAESIARVLFSVSPFGALVESFRQAGALTIEIYRQAGVKATALEGMTRVSELVTRDFLPLLLAFGVILSLALSIAAIPRIPAGRATGERYLFRFFSLPDWTLIVFIVGGLSPLASGTLRVAGFNLLGAVIVLYALQGMAILRYGMMRNGVGPIGTTLIFVLASILAPYTATVFFLAGLFDPFFDFRKLNRKEESNESDLD